MKNTLQTLKAGVLAKDAKLIGRAIDSLRMAGHNYRDCYRLALAVDPTLTLEAWDAILEEADDQ